MTDALKRSQLFWWIILSLVAMIALTATAFQPGPILTLDNVAAPGRLGVLFGLHLDSALLQRILLLLAVGPGLLGTLVLARPSSLLISLAIALFWMSNPFIVERLFIGQWQLLVALGALPWLLLAMQSLRNRFHWPVLLTAIGLSILMITLYPRSLTLLQLVFIAGVVAPWVIDASRGQRWQRLGIVLVGWLITSTALHSIVARSASLRFEQSSEQTATLFAVGTGPFFTKAFGVVNYLGFWAERAQRLPTDLSALWWFWLPAVFLLPITLLGWQSLLSAQRTRWLGITSISLYVLCLALVISSAAAAHAPWLTQLWDWLGFVSLRETGKFMGGMLIAQSIGLATGLATERLKNIHLWLATALIALLSLLLPTSLAVSWESLQPVHFPPELVEVSQQVNMAQQPVVIFPWHRYQVLPFTDGRIVDQIAPTLFDKAAFNELVEYQSVGLTVTEPWQHCMAEATSAEQINGALLNHALDVFKTEAVVIFKTNDWEKYVAWAQSESLPIVAETPEFVAYHRTVDTADADMDRDCSFR